MQVSVKLHYVFRGYAPVRDFKKPFALNINDGAVLGDVLGALGLPDDRTYLFFVGSRRAGRDKTLNEGDTVTILPPIIGG